jgi:peptidoglycan hydrolase-like protein with peptidoglycan-binding domain
MAGRKKKSAMTTAAISNLPFQAGGAVAAAVGRAVLWAVGQYMRQPLRNTAVTAMVGLSSLAGSNALYFQSHRHPAPLFGVVEQQVAATEAKPVFPATRPKTLKLPLTDKTTTGSVDAAAPMPPAISNAEVFELQRKLQALQLFEGKIDGLYGPKTARSIRAFEELQGLKPKGELTRQIVDMIISTSIIAAAPKVEPLPTPDPLPVAPLKSETAAEPVKAEPVKLEIEPAPAPASAAVDPSPLPKPLPLTRDYPETPDEALNLVADTASDALDTIIEGVQSMTQTKPTTVTKRVVQTIPVKAITQTAALQPLPDPLPAAAVPAEIAPATTNAELVSQVQRGLSSLGFLHTSIDGVAGEATAKAIRNFEVYYNYDVTGRVTPGLVKLLVENGAVI